MKKLNLAVFATAAVMCFGSAFAEQAATAPAPAPTPVVAPAASAAPAVSTPATAAPAVETASAKDENEVICENQPPPTGSLLGGTRHCMTRRQWDDQDKNSSVSQDMHRMSMGSGVAQ